MTVSILLAVYNAAQHLPDCLDSIAAHAPGVTVLVQDGGSTDNTLALLAAHPCAPQVVSEPDAGIYDALHKAIDRAQTDFIYILGADDRLLPDWSTAAAQLRSLDTLYYANARFTHSGKLENGTFDAKKLARTNICQQAIFYPRPIFQRHRFDLRYRLLADWALNMACWKDPEISFQHLPLTVSLYNNLGGSSSRGYDDAFVRDYPFLLLRSFGLPAFLRHGIPALLAHHTRRLRGKT